MAEAIAALFEARHRWLPAEAAMHGALALAFLLAWLAAGGRR